MSPSRLGKELNRIFLDYATLAKIFPDEARQILKKMRKGKLRIEFEHQGLENLIQSFDKISNRIMGSLIIAALIVGSSLIMQTSKGFLLFGFPVIGVIGFILAGIIGFSLIISIIRSGKL